MKLLNQIRQLLVFSTALFIPLLLSAQTIANDEFSISINNWERAYRINQLDAAIRHAEKAFEFAKRSNNKAQMALAIHNIGLSLVKKKNRGKKNRKLAKEKFEESLFYLADMENPKLRIDNLEQLKWIAETEENLVQATVYEKQIEQVKKLTATNAKNRSLNEKNESLNAQNESLSEDRDLLENRVGKLAVQKKVLSKKVKSLSQAQLESELVIALQKNQVDSMGFELTKDSLLIQQKELMLAEQAATLELQESQLGFQKSQLSLKESQLSLQQSQRNFFLALAAIVGLLGIGTFTRFKETQKHNELLQLKNEIIASEKKKSEELLLNILPSVVANELKLHGEAKARKYENATVLFSDFKNFSAIAEKLSPERLVKELDFYFKTFDDIISNYKLEKIKTIGDLSLIHI